MLEEILYEVEDSDKLIQMLKGEFLTIGYDNNQEN